MAAAAADDPHLPGYLSNLGNALLDRSARNDSTADLNRAVEVGEAAVAAAAADGPDLPGYLSNLGNALLDRFARSDSLADVNRAVEAGQAAVAALAADDPDRPTCLSNLGNALWARYEQFGGLSDLEGAIDVGQTSVDAVAGDDPLRPAYLSNLSNALRSRYEETGELGDLNRSVDLTRQAVDNSSSADPNRANYLTNLATALRIRFERSDTTDPADIDQSIRAAEAAVLTFPADHPASAPHLSNLGLALQARHERLQTPSDIRRAVKIADRTVDVTLASSPDRPAYLSNLCIALLRQFEADEAVDDLNRAISVCEESLRSTPVGRPDRARYSSNYGLALQARYRLTRSFADMEQAVQAFRDAAATPTAPANVRARAARQWGRVAGDAGAWSLAVEGDTLAIELLARLAPRSLNRTDQEYWLAELAGLGSHAAACCLEAGRTNRAVELWEQGRAVLYGQALDARTDLTELASAHPHLAAEFGRLRNELDRPIAPSGDMPRLAIKSASSQASAAAATGKSRGAVNRRRAIAEEFDALIDHIRSMSGFEQFLLPLPVTELLRSAAEGPVVLLNVTDIRSDAMLLVNNGVEVVALPELDPSRVEGETIALLEAIAVVQKPTAGADDKARAETDLVRILEHLWAWICGPVLTTLGLTDLPKREASEERPRVWWCPSGLLGLLPLHAAGRHQTRFNASPETVLDLVLSSYTPTIRALTFAREAAAVAPGPPSDPMPARLLVVAMPHTPGEAGLPGALNEAALLRQQFGDRVHLLHGELRADDIGPLGLPATEATDADATHARVSEELQTAQWAHFACHAISDVARPSASRLLLADHENVPLTVLDLSRQRSDRLDFAFLSACATARTAPRLADEVLHLASALQLAGCRHVLATLWPVGDQSAVAVARMVYQTLSARGSASAPQALNDAVRRRRNLSAATPSAWGAHVHHGT